MVNELTNFRPLDFSYASTKQLVSLLKNPMKLGSVDIWL